jgi:hypothetical protein
MHLSRAAHWLTSVPRENLRQSFERVGAEGFYGFGQLRPSVLYLTEWHLADCSAGAEPGKPTLDFWFYAGAAFAAVDLLGPTQ